MQESEALNLAVLNSMMANIAVVDRHGTIIAVNEGWERFAQENGCDPTSPKVGVGANYLEVCVRAARDLGAESQEILNGIKGVLAHSQVTFSHEYPCHSPTEQRWFSMLVSPLDRTDGGAVITQVNITERKQAEESLFRSQEMLRIVLDNIPARVFWKDLNLVYLGCNSACARDAGLGAASEIIGKSDFDVAWKGSAETYRADDLAVIESRIPRIGFEEAMHRPDGTIGTLITSKLPLHDRDGNVFGMLGTYEDITERKREEIYNRRMATVMQDSNDAITIQDFEGRITAWNRGAELMYGFSEAEALLMNIELLTAPDKIAEQKDFIRRLIAGEAITSFETQRVTKDGRVLDVWMTVTKLMDDAGNPVGLASTERDITGRLLMEARLGAALITAEAGNRAKSEFLGIMSHELRTPLNGVLGSAELLTYTPLDEEQDSLVETVSKCGEHLLSIVKDILDFSSIEAGQLAINVAPMAVAEVVGLAARAVQISAIDKGLVFRCETNRDVPPRIAGDALRIRQILINLLGNAVKFTSSGSVVLRVTSSGQPESLRTGRRNEGPVVESVTGFPACEPVQTQAGKPVTHFPGSRDRDDSVEPTASRGESLDFSVEDTGIGISSETIGLLFKPFTQVGSTSTRAYGGTGLGLAISKRLAEAMGGSIAVASIPGKGSTFTFHLPLESAPGCAGAMAAVASPVSDWETNESAQPEPRPPVQTAGTPPAGNLVLVVEDNPENSTVTGKMLRSLGYRAEFAADGGKAVDAFVTGKYFAILMDVVMPAMDGIDATKNIREVESRSRVPIIALTANVLPGNRELCLAAGMDDFLTKPFKRNELASILARLAQR